MKPTYNEILEETVAEVLETSAFLTPIPVEEDMEIDEIIQKEGNIYVGLTFQGPSSGKLILSIPEPLSLILAANMLGVDEDEPDAKQKSIDAIKEASNIICGTLLPKIYGKAVSYTHLTLPTN